MVLKYRAINKTDDQPNKTSTEKHGINNGGIFLEDRIPRAEARKRSSLGDHPKNNITMADG